MKKYLIALAIGIIIGFLFLSCNKECPECPECPPPEECPECPETLECPDGYTRFEDILKWECVQDTPPPPPNCDRLITTKGAGEPATGDYTQNCDGATGRLWTLCIQRQEMIWQGVRSPQFVASNCPTHVGEIDATVEILQNLATDGSSLIKEMDRFYDRLQQEDPECPGRTVVNRAIYDKFQDKRKKHMADIKIYDDNAQNHPCRDTESYDTMQGWCSKCFGRSYSENVGDLKPIVVVDRHGNEAWMILKEDTYWFIPKNRFPEGYKKCN